jgi:hypothetical protein
MRSPPPAPRSSSNADTAKIDTMIDRRGPTAAALLESNPEEHTMRPITRVLAFLLAATMAAAPARAGSVWIEGEAPTKASVNKHGWYDGVKKEGMSGGDWLSHYGPQPGEATYKFDAPEAGDYAFWWRGNVSIAKVDYKLNDGEWTPIAFTEKRGEYMISDKPDHRFLAWVKVAKVKLAAGANTIAFKFHSDISNHGGIDCFLFDNTGFIPSGATRPGVGPTTQKAAAPDEAIWIEGENPTSSDVTKHGWYDGVKKEGMSGGDWLSHYDTAKPGTATYKFNVVKEDDYAFWWRGNVSIAKVSYKLDGGDFVPIAFTEKRGEYMLSEKPDHRFLAWVKVGRVKLTAGPHAITFKLHSDVANHGGIDCFVFTRIPFVPSGGNKPTSAVAAAAGPSDWFPVVFDADAFSEKSVIDMSGRIEAPAGQHGFLTAAGADLKFEAGKLPVKFWGCGANLQAGTFIREQLTQRIKYLRKHGINMVRQHPVQDELGPLVDGKFDAQRLDNFDWWCAELKKQGIYMTWSVFYGVSVGPGDGYPPELLAELDVRDAAKNIHTGYGLTNTERQLQDIQLKYMTAILLHKNPYTGLRYVDDPEVAVLEFQNEDCVFFYNPLNGLQQPKQWPLHAQRLRRAFFDWAAKKYGDEAGLKKAWGGLRGGDSFAKKELELMGAHHFGSDGPTFEFAGQTKRAGDFIEFLTQVQRGFYERREKEVRDMGFKAVTVTTAWRSGGPAADPANLYCDTVGSMIDRHNYFGGGEGGHGIALGKIENQSHLTLPGSGLLSIGMYQVKNKPFSCTEWTSMPPNEWKAEAAPLFAFYGMGLQGWDASYHFLNSRAYPGDGWSELSKYSTDTPHYMGQFPALALAVMRGDLKEAPTAASRDLTMKQVFSGSDPLHQDFTGGGHDVKTLQGQPLTPMQVLAIGKVTVGFDDDKPVNVEWSKYWDESKKTITSMTGELVWDYGHEVVTVGSPRTQAVIGKAGGGRFDLPGLTVSVKTPFVSLIFTSLDDKPIAESRHVLITAMARDRQTETKYSPDGTQLTAIGGPPLLMEPVQATVKLKGAAAASVNVLDVYGVPTGKTVKPGADGAFDLSGEYGTYYYEVTR